MSDCSRDVRYTPTPDVPSLSIFCAYQIPKPTVDCYSHSLSFTQVPAVVLSSNHQPPCLCLVHVCAKQTKKTGASENHVYRVSYKVITVVSELWLSPATLLISLTSCSLATPPNIFSLLFISPSLQPFPFYLPHLPYSLHLFIPPPY